MGLGQCVDAPAFAPSGELLCQSLSQDAAAWPALSTRAVRRAKTSLRVDARAAARPALSTRAVRRAKTSLCVAASGKPGSETHCPFRRASERACRSGAMRTRVGVAWVSIRASAPQEGLLLFPIRRLGLDFCVSV